MCKVLVPIKPEYVNEILAGRKKYEYRKIRVKNPKVDKMIIYATSPVMKIVGEIEVIDILEDSPRCIWQLTKNYSGITKDFYDEYYQGKDRAIAYKIGQVKKYDSPINLSDIGINFYPQSFVYLD